MASDGCLISDGRHINLTSKDLEQLNTFKRILGINTPISWKWRGDHDIKYPQIQFSNVRLYRWFLSIGITPQKSKTISEVAIPDQFFFDFLRGEFDGDGSSYAYWDTRWRSSVSIYINFCSASRPFLTWVQQKIFLLLHIEGNIKNERKIFVLQYSKSKAKILYTTLYANQTSLFLKRKKDKLDRQWLADEMSDKGMAPKFKSRGSVICIS
jgi:hypothetical protein